MLIRPGSLWRSMYLFGYWRHRQYMLLGEYLHTLDPKKRVSLPAKFRKEVGKKVVITRGLDACLFVYPLDAWKKISEKLQNLSIGQADQRGFNRFLLSGAVEVDVDSVGRILIPDFLKDFASLRNRVVLAGVSDRIEVWDERNWKEYKKRIERQADAMAEKLGELGVL
jgi:MraZ protein